MRTMRTPCWLGVVMVVFLSGCQSAKVAPPGDPGHLRFPIANDPTTLDPANIAEELDLNIAHNIFDGLYKVTGKDQIVPDIATGMPVVTGGGTVYTFAIRHGVKFSNGDPVTSADVLFSWNRAAALQGPYASEFQPIQGYSAVAANKAKTMSGLSAPDAYTVKAELSSPAGYWFTELANLAPGDIVDSRVVTSLGDAWWTTPSGLVGTGPFEMVARTPNQSMDFAPVKNWWGGSTGDLTSIHIDVLADAGSQAAKYESGGYDVIGLGFQDLSPTIALEFKNNPTYKGQLHLIPSPTTIWLGYNYVQGPLAGPAGKLGRQALNLAVNRSELVNVACANGLVCSAATGGLISRGLVGYLGNNTDPNAVFNAQQAKQMLAQWDPTGQKTSSLTLSYPSGNALYAQVMSNVTSQWRQNLGINVTLQPMDPKAFESARSNEKLEIFQDGWGADYDNPQDWFDNIFIKGAAFSRTGYSNPAIDSLVSQADALPLSQGVPLYNQASQQVEADAPYNPLYYLTHAWVIKPYVSGVTANGIYESPWLDISVS